MNPVVLTVTALAIVLATSAAFVLAPEVRSKRQFIELSCDERSCKAVSWVGEEPSGATLGNAGTMTFCGRDLAREATLIQALAGDPIAITI